MKEKKLGKTKGGLKDGRIQEISIIVEVDIGNNQIAFRTTSSTIHNTTPRVLKI